MFSLPYEIRTAENKFQLCDNMQYTRQVKKKKVTGHHVRSSPGLAGQTRFLAGHCPLTGRYFVPLKGVEHISTIVSVNI